VIGWREDYYLNLGKALYAGKPISEADLDFKRGYFAALARLFNEPEFSARAIERDLNRKERESE
jgi:hypothetical protein